ncbi:hypothetical protein L9F63_013048, partial [Diploptera punctata]
RTDLQIHRPYPLSANRDMSCRLSSTSCRSPSDDLTNGWRVDPDFAWRTDFHRPFPYPPLGDAPSR